MAFATLDGIKTHYVTKGSGPHLLMMAPRGFDSTLQSWDHGKWNDMKAIDTLAKHFTVVAYDRRESGQSGGRVEKLTWTVFARHAKLLAEHLGVERAFVIGVCMGVGVAAEFASLYPEACHGLLLAQPVGGHRWMLRMRTFFDRHIDFVGTRGLAEVCARAKGKNFMADPEAGPWASVLAWDMSLAARFEAQNVDAYLAIVAASRDAMFPDSFVSGPSPDVLMSIDTPASIWPGDDASHSTSGAHQLRELMPRMEYWDLHPSKQHAENMLDKIVAFKRAVENGGLLRSPAITQPPMPPRI